MFQSFKYAIRGVVDAFKSEFNLRIHFIIATIVLIAGYLFSLSAVEWAILILVITFVIIMEMVNTVIEKTIDIASPQISEKARVVKDISAAVVLFTAISAVVVGCLLFIPKIVAL